MSLHRQIMLDSPAGYWPLDETSGTTAFDRSGNARNGTVSGATVNVAGPAGLKAYSFDGASDWVTRAVETWMNTLFAGSYSFEVWIKFTGTATYRLVGKRSSSVFQIILFLGLPAAGQIRYYVDGSDANALNSVSSILNDGRWHHLVAVRDATGSPVVLRLYIDGELDNSRDEVAAPAATTTGGLFLGYDGFSTPYYLGQAAQMAATPTALSAARIKAHYEAGIRSGVVV